MKKILALNKYRKAFLLGIGVAVVVFLVLALTNSGVYIAQPRFLQKSSQIKSQTLYPPSSFEQLSADDDITKIVTETYNQQMAGIPLSDRPSIDEWYAGNGQSVDFSPEGPPSNGAPPSQPGGGQQCQQPQPCRDVVCFRGPCPQMCPPWSPPPPPPPRDCTPVKCPNVDVTYNPCLEYFRNPCIL